MLRYSWKFSLVVALVIVISIFVLILGSVRGGVAVVGTLAATLLDVRFLALFALGLILNGSLNPIFISALLAAIYAVYLQITLVDIRAELGINAGPIDYFWPPFVVATLLYSTFHAVRKK